MWKAENIVYCEEKMYMECFIWLGKAKEAYKRGLCCEVVFVCIAGSTEKRVQETVCDYDFELNPSNEGLLQADCVPLYLYSLLALANSFIIRFLLYY